MSLESDLPGAAVSAYITNLFVQEDQVLQAVRARSAAAGLPDIAITPEEGAFLHLLARLVQPRLALEIGALGGYSTIWLGRALPPGGKLISLEKSARHAEIARAHLALADLSAQVELRQGEAAALLPKLAPLAPFDLVFIDADKPNTPAYFDWALAHLRPGGLIAVHNALWGGSVARACQGAAVDEVRAFNAYVASLPGVRSSIYPAGDGTLLAVKLPA